MRSAFAARDNPVHSAAAPWAEIERPEQRLAREEPHRGGTSATCGKSSSARIGRMVTDVVLQTIEVGLTAMFRLFAATGDTVAATARTDGRSLIVELTGAGTELPAPDPLFDTLVTAVGGTRREGGAPSTLAFSLPSGTSSS